MTQPMCMECRIKPRRPGVDCCSDGCEEKRYQAWMRERPFQKIADKLWWADEVPPGGFNERGLERAIELAVEATLRETIWEWTMPENTEFLPQHKAKIASRMEALEAEWGKK